MKYLKLNIIGDTGLYIYSYIARLIHSKFIVIHSIDKRYTSMVTTKQHLTLTLRTPRKDSNNTPLITTSWAAILGRLVFPHFIRYFTGTQN